jgi:hypothetical protein
LAGTGDPDAAFTAIATELDRFSVAGLTAEIRASQEIGAGSLKVIGTIYDSAGHDVGRFSRDLLVIGDRWRAFHMAFELDPHVRGGAFRSAFFQHAEAVYRKYGIDDVRVSAEKIGSYLWAKEGFRFCGDIEGQRQAQVELWKSRGRTLAQLALERGDLTASFVAGLDATFTAIEMAESDPLEPREIANFGKNHTWVANGHTVWLGKEILIDWNWNGIKEL